MQATDVYPPEAFHLVLESLSKASEQIHGPLTAQVKTILTIMHATGLDAAALQQAIDDGALPEGMVRAISAVGGICEIGDRHVGATDLCHAIRDTALERWGLLAQVVLRQWNITKTMDIGRIVYHLVQHGTMSKRQDDLLSDFDAVYEFDKAFSYTLSI
jgi:uncharacterized repeat protein (TIGR04138 family)